ncbi:MAG: choice-of-anchor I family protein, partial [Verrucomicrobiae bacterium]|nr:choice-of-anchor I family protein [Verrucomicrobiae bacterium]
SSIPSILLSAGDNFIPGPFFSAAGDGSLRDTFQTAHDELFGLVPDTLTNIREGDGRADVTIMNILGIDASAFGNHEFDAGTTTLGELLKTDIRGPGLGDVRWLGTQFPYLSTNLDFSSDANLSGVYTSDILPNTDFASLPGDLDAAAVAPKIAQATIIDRGGLKIGVVGATTQRLPVISSPGDTTEATTGGTEDMDALAAALQPVIDALILEGPKIIILTSHLQQISLEEELLTKLSGVDLVIAGGSDTLLADGTDVLHPGDVAAGGYPIITTNLDGDPAAVVSTDGEYSYVGRLIATFDTDGKLLPASIDPAKSGAFATMDDTVEGLWGDLVLPFAPLTKGAQVKRITDGVSSVVTAKDGNIFGKTAVFLEGRREKVRTEETNLGNLTADANLWVAQQYDSSVAVSLKNGGGIRAPIGAVDGFSGELLITPANPDAGKEEGDISQLDIENSLRFNNELSLVTLSAADLKEILEAGLSGVAPGATPGSFPQVGGMAVTYDPSAEAGSRVTDLVIKNAHELVTDVVVRDGAVVGDPDREIRVVTLNFLAGGGDGYPFDTLGEDRVDLVGTLTDPGVATFAAPGSEQDAMAEYVAAWFAETPFMKAETAPRFDRRIQRLDQRWVNGNSLVMKVLGTYETRIFDEGASEIVDFDPMTQRAFVVNADAGVLDVLDLSDPSKPVLLTQVDQPGSVNSVAVKNGIVATAVQNDDDTLPGWIVFHDTDGNVLSTVTAGVLPDMVTFSPDGLKVLTANEGEPLSDYSVDPEGSVTIVDLGDGSLDAVAALAEDAGVQVTFEAFNDKVASLANKGIRIFGPGSTVAQDLEPEYIAVSPDGTKAFVTLQENNGIAVIDIAAGKVLDILPLGYKDHSKGQPWLEAFTWKEEDLPELGLSTADDTTPILLGGFSGLWYAADESTDESKVFYTIPDRGPNGDAFTVDGVTNREFLLPDYQARIVKFTLDTTTGALAVADQILLTRDDGGPVPILGLPNIPGWDEVPLNGKSEEVAYDPYGGDMEGIVRHPDGTFWTVDEYRPAIYHFEADGSLIERYVPEGTSLLGDTPMPEGTYGAETLPAEYAKRWSNRGFEAVALDPDNDIVYAFIQSPMHNPDNSTQNKSDVIRILGVNAADGTPVSEYIYLLERNADAGFGFARTDKIGDAVYAGNGKFYVLERDSSTPDDPTIGHKYIFEIDINYATNLMDGDAPAPLEGKTWEQHSADDLAAVGVSPVWKLKVTNLPTLGYVPSDKAEGLALMEDGTLAICNDNDFTQAGYPNLTLGLVHFGDNNAIDASNRDDAINIVNWPVLGMYQPDSIAAYEYEGVTYLVTANEGDARDYDAFSEEERVGGLTLDPTVFPDAATLQEDENLGRLNSTTATGDLDGDGDHDRIVAYGARSFSIWDQYGNLVFDSGADLELITSLYLPADFNSTNTENDSFDSRSDDKGPEPEGLALGEFNGHTYAFIGLERIGGVVVYDITHPQHPAFMTYINNRDFSGDAEAFTAGDLGPEGLKFVSAEDSPTRMPLLIVGNEISGTTTVYSVDSLIITPPGSFGVAGVDQTSISLSWVKTGAGTVIIEKWVDGKWVEIAAIDGEETTWTDTGLKPGSKNKYRIFQKDGDAYSAIGDTIELKTDGDSIPVNDPSTSIIASTTTEPYVTGAGISKVFSMLTVGDEVPLTDGDEATYRMVGIPDGLGALDNGDGTFSLFVHHELPSSEGIERDHGAIGAFISEWIISKFGGEGGLEVLSGQDLIKTVMVWDPDAGEYVEADAYAFNRLCSADLPGPGAFYFNGFGTHERLFLGGEENDAFFGTLYGRAFATFVTGEEKGTTYEIPRLGDYAFENVVASPFPQKKTIVVGLDDSASSTEDTLGEIWIYVGDKTKEGSEFEKSGLNNGSLYAVAVEGLPIENIPFGLGLGKGSTAAFSLVDFGDVSDDDGTGLFDLTVANNELGVTKFMRPEDGHWDTLDPNSFFFVTTGRFGAPGRVWKLIFDDITHPEEGGTIQLVLDGSEGMTSPDNITVNWKGDLLIQEDPGGAALQARIWKSDRATGETYVVAEHNADFFTPEGANFLTTNEEASGIIDMKDILGYGWYLISVQAHADNADPELVEDGQLAAIFVPDFNMTSAPATASIPMLVPTLDNVKTEAFLTTGDSVGGYRMAGIPDGLGAYDNGDGTFTVLMHHELGNTVGIQRDHGAIGAFISEWTITKPGHPDGGWNVISGGDLIQEVMVWDRGSGKYKANPAVSFNRFCSADLPAIGAFYWDGYGTEDRIFLGGEENDAFYGSEYGKAWAHAATGDYKGTSWEIPRLGQSSWENIVASPYPQLKTIVAGLDDSASADFDTLGEVYFYIGNKEMEGS